MQRSFTLPALTLAPGQTKLLKLADYQQAGQIPEDASWGTVTLSYRGRTGDLVAIASSYDASNRYGSQTPFTEGTNRLFKGSMWHVDSTHNTLITTGNGGTEPTRAQVTLFYNGGQGTYRVEQTLAPGAQIWLNLADLIRNQVPDSDGKTIPVDVMAGSYELRDLDHAVLGLLYEGKLVVDKTYGHASYGCAHCCGYSRARLWQNPFSGPPGINNTDTYQAYGVCESQWYDMDVFFNPYSSNTAVATLGVPTLHTVAMGLATASGKNTLSYQASNGGLCSPTPMTGTQPVTVQVPTSLSVISASVLPDGSGPPNGCPGSANYGIKIDIKYQVLDQNMAPLQSSNMTPHEKGTFFTGGNFDSDIGPVSGYPTSSKNTAPDGTFHDVPFGACSNLPISNPGLTGTQNITIIMADGTTYPVRSQSWTVTAPGSASFGHGEIKNAISSPGSGSDVDKTR